MALRSNLFAGDKALEACAVSHPAHITKGAHGRHVRKIQAALLVLGELPIDQAEIAAELYGPSTANAVLDFKKKRDIVNRSYQQAADDIVGIMTIKALDDELFGRQVKVEAATRTMCGRQCGCATPGDRRFLAAALTPPPRLRTRAA